MLLRIMNGLDGQIARGKKIASFFIFSGTEFNEIPYTLLYAQFRFTFSFPCGKHICRLYKFAFWHQHTFIERSVLSEKSLDNFFPFVSPNWDFFMCYVHFNSVNAIVDKIIELLSTYGEHKQCGTNDYIEFTADDDIITNKFFALSQFHLFCTARCYFFVVLPLLLYEHRAVCLYNTIFFLMMSESTWTFNEIGAVQLNMLVRNKMMNLSLR